MYSCHRKIPWPSYSKLSKDAVKNLQFMQTSSTWEQINKMLRFRMHCLKWYDEGSISMMIISLKWTTLITWTKNSYSSLRKRIERVVYHTTIIFGFAVRMFVPHRLHRLLTDWHQTWHEGWEWVRKWPKAIGFHGNRSVVMPISKNSFIAHTLVWWSWIFVCGVRLITWICMLKMSKIYSAVFEIGP